MKDFKQIAEDCLSGKLSGVFILRDGSKVNSNHLKKLNPSKHLICSYSLGECWISDDGNAYGKTGYLHKVSIINFIPDKNIKQENNQIKINIPEGMEAVQEIIDGEIRIKFVEKKLTYDVIKHVLHKASAYIEQGYYSSGETYTPKYNERNFYKKLDVLRKLTNIRNYFGKPESDKMGYCIVNNSDGKITVTGVHETNPNVVVFRTFEHAKEAINLIGYDELKYLFEIW